ncbi:MAG: carbohydrate ABC transporter permease [Armatimonadota bacterium]|nr:carbohydrate ABC transporter permease [Armatimonadota bacterium]MDR7448050.1 carbohydrate ABC transporter permease [Armatimonadota bacterium]MDR7459599.1 carbohydrate ABC transporter permease [Armatimonadota bacterium]MDR7478644.1 carbohydrate ABC transporter permease [Armatimonadota bacterium]MDR7488039.1 carbohydrate ABC transporter permease [Armatimonadota bacterium]
MSSGPVAEARAVLPARRGAGTAAFLARWARAAGRDWWWYLTGVVILVLYVTPFAWMILGSLRREVEIFEYTYPLTWRTFVPVEWTLKNFLDVLGLSPEGRAFGLNFGRALAVTAFVSAAVVLSSLVVNTMGAYFFARLDFPRKEALLLVVIATMLIPFEAVMVPLYIVVRALGVQDTVWALVLPWYASPFVIFALVQFFKEIPRELDEAAIIDGASFFGVLRHVIVPNAVPGLVTTALLEFQFIWNLFYWPLIAVGRKELQTIQVAIAQQTTQTQIYWGRIFAGSVLASVPIILLFLLMQRYYVRGVVLSGVKG